MFTQGDTSSSPEPAQLLTRRDDDNWEVGIAREAVREKITWSKVPWSRWYFSTFLKKFKYSIAELLAVILLWIIDSWEVLSFQRKANVESIYGKGNKHTVSNYQPKCLTSEVGKLLHSCSSLITAERTLRRWPSLVNYSAASHNLSVILFILTCDWNSCIKEVTPKRSRVLHSRRKELIYNINVYFIEEQTNRGIIIAPSITKKRVEKDPPQPGRTKIRP